MDTYLALSSLITGIIVGILAFVVLWKKRGTEIGLSFFYLAITISLYTCFYSLFPLFNFSREYSLIIFRLISIPAVFSGPTFFHFVLVFVDKKEKYKKSLYLSYLLSLFFVFFVGTDLFIKDMVPKFLFDYWAVPGIIHHLFVISLFVFSTYGSIVLLRSYKESDNTRKAQLRLFYVGMLVMFIAGSTNFFYWYNINIPPVAMPLMATFPFLVAYAIVAHGLFDIKIILRKSVVYTLSIVTVALFLFPFKIISVKYFSDAVSFFDFLYLLLALAVYPIIKNKYYYLANKYFFTSLYDSQQLITSLSRELRASLEIDYIYQNVLESIKEKLHSKSIAFLKYNDKTDSFKMSFNSGFNLTNNKKIFFSNNFLRAYIKKSILFCTKTSDKDLGLKYSDDIDVLRSMEASILIPLVFKYKVIGVIVLGEKESKELYNSDDKEVLEIVGGLIAISLSNASLFNNLEKKKNDLEELLGVKSKFLRIINHQLNTPLSKINLGIYALKEKNVSQERAIEAINNGAEQMNNFLTDYWNSFEFEGGKTKKMNITNFDVYKIVKKVVAEKKVLIKKKNIKLAFKKPTIKTKINADPNFIEQVVSNIFENAI